MTEPIAHTYSPGSDSSRLCMVCNAPEPHLCRQPAPSGPVAARAEARGRDNAVDLTGTGPAAVSLETLRLRERVMEMERICVTVGDKNDELHARAEAAEACTVELATVLLDAQKIALDAVEYVGTANYASREIEAKEKIWAHFRALESMSAKALERARAKDSAVAELLVIWDLIGNAGFMDISNDDDLVVVTIQAPHARRIRAKLDALQPAKEDAP